MEPETKGKQRMKTYSGTVRFSVLEGGFWQLESADGHTYELAGSIQALKDGQRVAIQGEVQPRRISFRMGGPVLVVKKLELKE